MIKCHKCKWLGDVSSLIQKRNFFLVKKPACPICRSFDIHAVAVNAGVNRMLNSASHYTAPTWNNSHRTAPVSSDSDQSTVQPSHYSPPDYSATHTVGDYRSDHTSHHSTSSSSDYSSSSSSSSSDYSGGGGDTGGGGSSSDW